MNTEEAVLKIAKVIENMIWIGDSLQEIGECMEVMIEHELPNLDRMTEWDLRVKILENAIESWKKDQGLAGLTVHNKYTDYLSILKEV